MSTEYLQLRRIAFSGPNQDAKVDLHLGVNVICGASDTGKSFLAESIDFMLGGSDLREIPERDRYAELALDLAASNGEAWRLRRAVSGGGFKLYDLTENSDPKTLKQRHVHDQADNLSGFLLNKIGLLGRRILRSSARGATQSLSFRNLARLVIVQEGEIQQARSPFWGGQFIFKTAELATIKLLLTGIDDSCVAAAPVAVPDSSKEIALIDELLSDLDLAIADLEMAEAEISAQLDRLERAIASHRETLSAAQQQLDTLLSARRELLAGRQSTQGRLDDIADLLARFDLLQQHYEVDLGRLAAIQECGSLFGHLDPVTCPVCGAPPDSQHVDVVCDADIDGIIEAAAAEIAKVERLKAELGDTVTELKNEAEDLNKRLASNKSEYDELDANIQKAVAPEVGDARAAFTTLVEERANVQKAADLYARVADLEKRKAALLEDDTESGTDDRITVGLSDSVAFSFSKKLSEILNAWNFPGNCDVHFDKTSSDFVIDGKARGSRGKGLRAITHAAVTIGIQEYCQEHDLPHPGFIVLDSPLLAYFKPEGDDDLALQGTDLKERFYEYLIDHHDQSSQVVIIENQHPPADVEQDLSMKVFTGNPALGRYGFL